MKNKIIFFGMMAVGVISGCNMNKEKDNSVNMSKATDSSMMTKTDTVKIAPANVDTAGISKKVVMVNPDPTKKGKKGKVSISLNNTKGVGAMNVDKDGFYENTEILPGFPGGQKALANFFEKNIAYPQDATDNGIEGTVKMNFAVDEKGKVFAPKLLNDNIGYGIETEALRVFNKMPAWTPGKIKGRNVKTKITLPITFALY